MYTAPKRYGELGHAKGTSMRVDLTAESRESPHRLPRRALPVIWAVLAITASVTVGVFIAAIPARYSQALHMCAGGGCDGQAIYLVALDIVTALGWTTLAAVIFLRRPGDRIGLFSALTFITFGVARFPDTTLALSTTHPNWAIAVEGLRFLGSACLSVYVFVFPDGHFHPSMTRWIAAGWILIQVPEFFLTSSLASESRWPDWLRFVGFLGFVAIVIAAQAWRYVRVATASERRQARWAALGLSVALTCYLLPEFGYPTLINTRLTPVAMSSLTQSTLITLTFLLVPVSVAYSMARHQLFDVDILINRTVVYGLTTLGVATLYFASITALQSLIGMFAGMRGTSPLIIVVSTLLIAFLFQPIRRTLQRAVDRRFYRRKYNADAAVRSFADSLLHEIDLADLRGRLLDITHETMQPSHASLWLRPPTRDQARS